MSDHIIKKNNLIAATAVLLIIVLVMFMFYSEQSFETISYALYAMFAAALIVVCYTGYKYNKSSSVKDYDPPFPYIK